MMTRLRVALLGWRLATATLPFYEWRWRRHGILTMEGRGPLSRWLLTAPHPNSAQPRGPALAKG